MHAFLVPKKVAIVGAGISGLAARHLLVSRGIQTTVFEKSRGAGGRASTRRGESWIADLGAQFFSQSSPSWLGILSDDRDKLESLKLSPEDPHPRFVHREGMSKVARALISRANVDAIQFDCRVTHLSSNHGIWQIQTGTGGTFDADALILTAPVTQALELLASSQIALSEQSHSLLSSVQYHPCLVAVLSPETDGQCSEWPAIWRNPSPTVAGIYDQSRKGLKSSRAVVVVHLAPQLSRELWESPPEVVADTVRQETARLTGKTWKLLHLHRWRYSQPVQNISGLFHRCSFRSQTSQPALLLAGDAFGTSSIDGALRSGEAAAQALLETAAEK